MPSASFMAGCFPAASHPWGLWAQPLVPRAAGSALVFSHGQAVSPRRVDNIHRRMSARTHTQTGTPLSIFQDGEFVVFLILFFPFCKKMQAKEKKKTKQKQNPRFSIEGTSLLQYEDIKWIESDPPCSGQRSPLVVAGAAPGWDGRELRRHLRTLPPSP